MSRKKYEIIIGIVVIIIAGLFIANRLFFSAPQTQAEKVVFVVNRNQAEAQTLDKLKAQGLIKNSRADDKAF